MFVIHALYIKTFRSLERKIIANQIQIFQGEKVLHFLLVADFFFIFF